MERNKKDTLLNAYKVKEVASLIHFSFVSVYSYFKMCMFDVGNVIIVTTVGWGSFHLGFTGNADPEPGRCRRTDGKKWRCSRDAVADGKYCERHMNRGRHRSRKHVEGQNGHAAKAMPIIAPSPSASAVPGGGSSNSLNISQQHTRNFQSSVADPSSAQFNRYIPINILFLFRSHIKVFS